MPENQPANGKLDSWKEIASYLGRDVRTVIRWEKKRNLPVHRLPGGQAVFAYKGELDDWLKQGTNGIAPLATTPEATPSPEPLQPPLTIPGIQRRFFGRHLTVVGLVGVLVTILAGMIFWQHRTASGTLVAIYSVT